MTPADLIQPAAVKGTSLQEPRQRLLVSIGAPVGNSNGVLISVPRLVLAPRKRIA
jgi:hypothetical protein